MVIDTHCHLDALDVPVLTEQLNPSHLYLTMGTHADAWPGVVKLAREHHNVFSALGLHPWYVTDTFDSELQVLEQLIQKYKPTAIGEIGLDFAPAHIAMRDAQLVALERQLDLSLQSGLPVSLHVYKAHNELIGLLKQYPVQGVVHSLGSSIQIARQYLDLGLKFGVNAILVRDNARRYHELVRIFGLESIVLETDSPNIPLPGKIETDLADIHDVIAQIARITGTGVEEVIRQTSINANQIFHFFEE